MGRGRFNARARGAYDGIPSDHVRGGAMSAVKVEKAEKIEQGDKGGTGFKIGLREVAAQIYVELVVRSTAVSETGVKMSADPVNLAKLSFKLAQAFETVQDDLNAENLPKNPTFKLGAEDVAAWLK